MSKLKSEYKNIIWYFFVPICVLVLFKRGIDSILNSLLVNPLLSIPYPAKLQFDIVVIVVFIIILVSILPKIAKGIIIPQKWYYLISSFTIFYLTYRISGYPFDFTSFSFNSDFKLLDLLSSIPILIIGFKLLFRKQVVKISEENIKGFTVDEPTNIRADNDLLNRTKFIKKLAQKIKNTTTVNGSFPIGIIAAWGSGKTTFLNTLLSEFQGKEFITIELNVWKCINSNQIIQNLFRLLNEKLRENSFSIDSKLQDYTSHLLKGTKSEELGAIKNLLEIISPNPSIEKQYDSINQEIKKINKKIIVFIDDLDRLDKSEIYEVVRLIRNTANFSNTFFVVAYDRNYILNAIEEINPYQSHLFLEKIFQLEFALPPISEKIIQSEITKRIEIILTEKGKKGYEYLLEKGFKFHEYGDADLTNLFVLNLRDVVRFINSFRLNYEFVKDEICFSDFYNLELVRFKHPELFLSIYRQHYTFLTTEKESNNDIPIIGNTYSLKMTSDNGTGISVLRNYINEQNKIYKLSNKEIDTICSAYSTIFPQPNSILSSRMKEINAHLTVLKPSMLDRYFVLGIEGKLSEIEFSKMRESPSEDFIEKIEELCKDDDLINDISERFEDIKEFDNKEDFEKIVKCIFHFANLSRTENKKDSRFNYIGFDGKSLAKMIGNENVFIKFYDSNKEVYKQFLLPLLSTDELEYTYTNKFVSSLLHQIYYYVEKFINKDEISDILFSNFKNAMIKSKTFTNDLWWYFMDCNLRVETPSGNNTLYINYPHNEKTKKIMRRFIFERGMDDFMLFSIRETPFDKTFVLENTIEYVFEKNKYFFLLLKICKKDLRYREEFIGFYEDLSKSYQPLSPKPKGVPLEFFKVIPLQYRKDN